MAIYFKKVGEPIFIKKFKRIEQYILIVNKKVIPIFIYNEKDIDYTLYIELNAMFPYFKNCYKDEAIYNGNVFDVTKYFNVEIGGQLQDDWNGLKKFIVEKCKQLNIITNGTK